MKYIKDFDLMVLYADAVRNGKANISDDALREILAGMEADDLYHPRYKKPSVHTIQFKVCQIVYYMFGYKLKVANNKAEKIVFSPLGNLLLDNKDDKKKVARIFLCMLYAMPFKHPFNKMSAEFNLFPFRLLFRLLCDPRLQYKLYSDEVFYHVMFVRSIDEDSYDLLIEQILKLRNEDPQDKLERFANDPEEQHVLANALHEWNYTSGVLEQAGIGNFHKSDNSYGILIHGKNGKETGRRRYRDDFFTLTPGITAFIRRLNAKYSFLERPNVFDIPILKSEAILKQYNFYPVELLQEIGIDTEEQEKIAAILNIPADIDKYSKNEVEDAPYRFEDVLCDAFNLFMDVTAEKHAVAGTTDIECIYTKRDKTTKFDVEAKSTRNKLIQLSGGRLKYHRELINSAYTIVVTPNFLRIVLQDIKGSESVLIRSATLSNFFYHSIIKNGRNLSYKPIHDIIINNLGKDATEDINQYIYENFGVSTI